MLMSALVRIAQPIGIQFISTPLHSEHTNRPFILAELVAAL